MLELLVRPHEAEREHRAAVVRPARVARRDGVRDHAQLLLRNAERGQGLASALGVDDDPLEAAERPAPEAGLRRRPPRQQVVGGEHERRAVAQQPRVGLRQREPLHVDDVGRSRCEARQAERVLEHLQRHAQPRAAEEARRERVEELAAPVAVGLGDGAEAKARRHELDVGSRASERGGERVVVRGREGRGVGDDDAQEVLRLVLVG